MAMPGGAAAGRSTSVAVRATSCWAVVESVGASHSGACRMRQAGGFLGRAVVRSAAGSRLVEAGRARTVAGIAGVVGLEEDRAGVAEAVVAAAVEDKAGAEAVAGGMVDVAAAAVEDTEALEADTPADRSSASRHSWAVLAVAAGSPAADTGLAASRLVLGRADTAATGRAHCSCWAPAGGLAAGKARRAEEKSRWAARDQR